MSMKLGYENKRDPRIAAATSGYCRSTILLSVDNTALRPSCSLLLFSSLYMSRSLTWASNLWYVPNYLRLAHIPPLLVPSVWDMCQVISDLHTPPLLGPPVWDMCQVISGTYPRLAHIPPLHGPLVWDMCQVISDLHTYLPYLGRQFGPFCSRRVYSYVHMCVMVYMSVYLCTVRNQSTQVWALDWALGLDCSHSRCGRQCMPLMTHHVLDVC
jgi:hypothetical protein